MGYAGALGMAEAAPLEVALEWHLRANHYPPLPAALVPICVEAIELASAGEWDMELDLGGTCTWRGQSVAPVWACVEGWHLEAFLDAEAGDGD